MADAPNSFPGLYRLQTHSGLSQTDSGPPHATQSGQPPCNIRLPFAVVQVQNFAGMDDLRLRGVNGRSLVNREHLVLTKSAFDLEYKRSLQPEWFALACRALFAVVGMHLPTSQASWSEMFYQVLMAGASRNSRQKVVCP